jgi:hypothetical protein
MADIRLAYCRAPAVQSQLVVVIKLWKLISCAREFAYTQLV